LVPLAVTFAANRASGEGSVSTPASGLETPPEQVVLAGPPRRPCGLAARDDDLASGLTELFGDLATGLAVADHQHSTSGERRGSSIRARVERHEVVGQAVGALRAEGPLVGPGADHDRPRRYLAE
jgi:hypothetical protein